MGKNLLVLSNASLELVPKELWGGKQVSASARKRGKNPGEMLLDVSLHGWDMERLPGRESRGRPDIVHQCLLDAMDSPAHLLGLLDVIVELRGEGGLMFFRPDVRLPRNYDQFKGLMEQVLVHGKAPLDGDPLIWIEHRDLGDYLRELGYEVYVMESKGSPLDLSSIPVEGVAYVVGAFQQGEMPQKTLALGRAYSLGEFTLTANAVVSLLSCSLYMRHLESLPTSEHKMPDPKG
ncbi:16S rRNA methyltransferase [Tardisphaera miroshnichenkoae]